MSAPPISYARTSDGVNVAYVDAGVGYPVVFVPVVPFSHLRESWEPWGLAAFSGQFRFIAYDPRGFGLSSQPEAIDYSAPAMLRDLEAVTTRAGLDRFAVYSRHSGVPIALAAAAAWPDRVRHVVSVDGWASFRQTSPQVKEVTPEIQRRVVAWHRYERYMLTTCPWLNGPSSGGSVNLIRLAESRQSPPPPPALFARALEAVERYDARGALDTIQCPALVVETRSHSWVPDGAAPEMAARLHGARLLAEDGADSDRLAALFARFLPSSDASPAGPRREPDPAAPRLSGRECEVLALVAAGKTDAQIADALTIAPATASRHVHNILEKLGMSRRSEAAAWWASNGNGRADG
jgi:pimeloyl-ACP methyl ester carboxylesterase/DNA-binding CsgD family transcriptional regulator